MYAACTNSISAARARRRFLACTAVLGAVLVGVMLWNGVDDSLAPAVVGVHKAPGLKGAVATSPDGGGRLFPVVDGNSAGQSRSVVEIPEAHAGPAGAPSGEKALYDLYSSLGVESVERVAVEILERPGPGYEKVALLRSLYDLQSAEFPRVFVEAIRSLPTTPSPSGVSVPSFAVRFLGERAARDPRARSVLEQVAFQSQPVLAAGVRRRAVATLAATGDEAQLSRLTLHLAREWDPLVARGALAALQQNPNKTKAEAIRAVFEESRHTVDKERLP